MSLLVPISCAYKLVAPMHIYTNTQVRVRSNDYIRCESCTTCKSYLVYMHCMTYLTDTYVHTYIHTYIHTHIDTYTYTCKHTHRQAHIHTQMHAHIHAVQRNAHTYKCIHGIHTLHTGQYIDYIAVVHNSYIHTCM